MFPPDLEALLARAGFRDQTAAHARMQELASDAAELAATCASFPSEAARLDAVRRFRRREILRIGAADLCGLFDLRQTAEQLSCLADAIVGQCLQVVATSGQSAGLIVLALGKL